MKATRTYGGYPQHDTVTVHKLGPNGRYGWVAKLGYAHSNQEYEWVQVYGVIGNSVKLLALFETHFSEDYGEETCQEVGGAAPFQLNTPSIRIHPQAPFIRSSCGSRAFRRVALSVATTAWSSMTNR